MIYLIEGNIGGGKTYYAISWILDRYYFWNPKYFEWQPKDKNGLQKRIFTNVPGLKLGEVRNLDEEIQRAGGLVRFFGEIEVNGDHQPVYEDVRNSIIIVDECHREKYFHKFFKASSVVDFFTYHRHYGVDIFLITQDSKNMAPQMRELMEYTIVPARQSLQLGGFRYKKMIEGECHGTTFHRYDKRIFDVYQTVTSGSEVKKEKSVLWRYVQLGVAMIVCLVIGWYYFIDMFKPKTTNHHVSASVISAPISTVLHQAAVVEEKPKKRGPLKKQWEVIGQVGYGKRTVYQVQSGAQVRYITPRYLDKYCGCSSALRPPLGEKFEFDEKELFYLDSLQGVKS